MGTFLIVFDLIGVTQANDLENCWAIVCSYDGSVCSVCPVLDPFCSIVCEGGGRCSVLVDDE